MYLYLKYFLDVLCTFSKSKVQSTCLIPIAPIAIALDKLQEEEHFYSTFDFLCQQFCNCERRCCLFNIALSLVNHSQVCYSVYSIAGTVVTIIERRFPHLLKLTPHSYVVAAISHSHFKMHWVPSEKKEWDKNVFIAEAIKLESSSASNSSGVVMSGNESQDEFFNFDDDENWSFQFWWQHGYANY